MQVESLRLDQIRPYEKNPRKNDEAVDQVAASIEAFGFKVPIIIDKDGVIVCGHTRYKAAKKLRLTEVPCIRAESLTEEQIKAYRIIDNKSQEVSRWDYEKLDAELDDIMDAIDMTPFGFSFDYGEDPEAAIEGPDIDNSEEIDINNFADSNFECECPVCGFKFTEGGA